MPYTLLDHRNDAMKCAQLKWNHEQQASGFKAKFWTIYDVFMVSGRVEHGKSGLFVFYDNTETLPAN